MADAPMKRELIDWKSDNLRREVRWGGLVEFVDGHIDSYNMESVLRLGYFRVKVPVFRHPFVVRQTILVFGMTWMWCFFFMLMHKSNVMLIDKVLVGQAANIFGYFGGMSGFLFGFFVFSRLGAFISVKNNALGGFWGNFQDLTALVGIWWPQTDSQTQEFKQTIVRWGMAAFNLLCGVADPDVTVEESIDECIQRNLLTSEEAAQVRASPACLPNIPLLWMMGVFEENLKGMRASDWKMDKLENKVLGMRGSVSGTLGAVSNFGQLPLPLVHLMSALIKIQLFLLATKEGVAVADIILGTTSGKTTQVLCCMLMVLSTPVIFQGLLEFVVMVANPFGSDWIDFPTHLFHQQIRDEMFQYIKVGEVSTTLSLLQK